ncbi:MAG: thioredoxin family protein [Pseudobacter sp.]|uniref:thioredoxin family protein n=1 Tax=Pseudobacter sp. TaxID=2045420 RepID=UPI003F815F60
MFLNITKKISVLLAGSFMLLNSSYAQSSTTGVQFSHGSWNEILELAKRENKAIFIDVYTEWCGPCKKMAAEIFPQQKVGEVFNANFINYKIDAEKGEGIHLAAKYEARAFPTYLFINNQGELVYRTTGYMQAEAFIKEAGIAIAEKNDPKPLVKWSDEYNAGNRNKDFLLGYLKKRQATELPSAALTDEVFAKLNQQDLQQKETWSRLLTTSVSTQFTPGGALYKYLVKHHKRIDSITGSRAGSLYILQFGMNNYVLKTIVPNKKETELAIAESSMKETSRLLNSADSAATWRKIRFDYYSKNFDPAKFTAAATAYAEQGICKRDPWKMIEANKAAFDKYMKPYLSGKSDSTTVQNWEMMKSIMRTGDAVNWSYQLRDVAEAVYMNDADKAMLQRGLDWAKKARDVFSHFSTEAVYAGLLFKNEKKEEAIRIFEAVSAKVPSIKASLFADNTAALRSGKTPKSLWK